MSSQATVLDRGRRRIWRVAARLAVLYSIAGTGCTGCDPYACRDVEYCREFGLATLCATHDVCSVSQGATIEAGNADDDTSFGAGVFRDLGPNSTIRISLDDL